MGTGRLVLPIDDGERLLLFDPLTPPNEIHKLETSRETLIVLTNPWHERDTQGLVERLGVTPLPDTAEDLGTVVETFRALA